MGLIKGWRWLSKPDIEFFEDYGHDSLVLNYGCGNRKKENQIGIDISENTEADFVVFPGTPLPFKENFFDVIISRYVFEHVEDLDSLLKELCRILKVGGILRFCVPHALSIDMYDDPTHRRFYTLRTMGYFSGKSNVHYANAIFSLTKVYLRLTLSWPRFKMIRYPANICFGILSYIAPIFSENLLKLPFLTGTLYFELRKDRART